LFRETAT